jgi:hypothetical protein
VNRKAAAMAQNEITEEERHRNVLGHLYHMKEFYGPDFDKLIIYGVKATDLVKFLENPEPYFNKSFVYVCEVYRAIDRIYKNYNIPFPKIPRVTDTERILLNLLLTYGEGIMGRDPYFDSGVKLHHVLAYLQRDKVIRTWQPYSVLSVQGRCSRAIQDLLHLSPRRGPLQKQLVLVEKVW